MCCFSVFSNSGRREKRSGPLTSVPGSPPIKPPKHLLTRLRSFGRRSMRGIASSMMRLSRSTGRAAMGTVPTRSCPGTRKSSPNRSDTAGESSWSRRTRRSSTRWSIRSRRGSTTLTRTTWTAARARLLDSWTKMSHPPLHHPRPAISIAPALAKSRPRKICVGM